MLNQRKIALSLFCLFICLHVVRAWLPPERCQMDDKAAQVDPGADSKSSIYNAPVVGNITEITMKQHDNLKKTYKDSKFFGVPIRGFLDSCDKCDYEVYVPNSCTFHTYSPSLLSSVYCQDGVACTLAHTVSTVESYTATEGYNWGVKVSTKFSVGNIFDVGGEASTGGEYSCAFTKGKTTTDNVECSVAAGGDRTLQLYQVRSDMECQFSTVTMKAEQRNGTFIGWGPKDHFTSEERMETEKNFILKARNNKVLPNLDRISDALLEKMQNAFPDYNPYTDIIALWQRPSYPSARFYKVGSVSKGPKKVIPFTNEAGNSVFQYACILT
ncbi:uncharacterized protein LOC119076639 [Bradysia coprophila]|uniref:uncharacterized protein LOC119076639 n=1 Tax=Bradysia coprophila TaxID=38358 RepID=UPI00187DAD2D|nr:uncharacterized protein LOC119076639 [Bradysia coprophila]